MNSNSVSDSEIMTEYKHKDKTDKIYILTKKLKKDVKECGQSHLFSFYKESTDKEREELIDNLKEIDFFKLKNVINVTNKEEDQRQADIQRIAPVDDNIVSGFNVDEITKQKWRTIGLQSVAEGKLGIILLAGGQATRLDFDKPKGMYKVGFISGKTLYQLHSEKILKLSQIAKDIFGYCKQLPLYIMTSEFTKNKTEQFFCSHSYFGLNCDDVIFFEQNSLPCFTMDGKMILNSKNSIARAPDGNGGIFEALKNKGIFEDMVVRGLEHIFVFSVDNVLAKIGDPYFIGCCAQKNLDASCKVIERVDPLENLGLIVKQDDHYSVVEYSHVSNEIKQMKDEKQEKLLYRHGNICTHYFSLNFIQTIIEKHLDDIKNHLVIKKVSYIDPYGNIITPQIPNAIKLEKFIFDVLPFAKSFGIFTVMRDEEYSPLKNGPGSKFDSPSTCLSDSYKYFKKLLRLVNVSFINENENSMIEISPLVSYSGEDLEHLCGKELDLSIIQYIQRKQ